MQIRVLTIRIVKASRALVCLAAIGVAGQLPATAAEASFDCTRASLPTERAICSSDELRALDRTLDEKYRAVLAEMDAGRRQALIKDQRAWLKHRNECCTADRVTGGDLSMVVKYLPWEYSLRLKDLEIARNVRAFTASGWSDPVIHGAAYDALDAQTRRVIVDGVRGFKPEHIADALADLSIRDTFTGELVFGFGARQVCNDLSEFSVTASRSVDGSTAQSKGYTFWSAIFYRNHTLVANLSIEPDAVLDCSSNENSISMIVDDDWNPRGYTEGVALNKSSIVYDRKTNVATRTKVVAPRLAKEQLIGLFTDEFFYYQIAIVDSRPTVVQITDLQGEQLVVRASDWDEAKGELRWIFWPKVSFHYGEKSSAWFEFTVNSLVGGLPAYTLDAKVHDLTTRYPRADRDVLRRVDRPIYRPLDFYYSRSEIGKDELRRDFFEEHEFEPDPRDRSRQAVCRKVDHKFVGFYSGEKFHPTSDIGPIPAGFDPKQCRMCLGDEQSRRQTCGFGRFEM